MAAQEPVFSRLGKTPEASVDVEAEIARARGGACGHWRSSVHRAG